MKGLMRKDFVLLREQAILFVIMIIFAFVAIFMALTNKDFTYGFVDGYISVVAAMLGVTTISYDQSDNGMVYLMTMPFDRKMYVNSKYMMSMILAVLVAVIIGIFNTIIGAVNGNFQDFSAIMLTSVSGASVTLLINSIGIPAFLKFEAQKGAIAMYLALAIIFVACFVFIKVFKVFGIDIMFILDTMSSAKMGALAGMAIVVAIICLLISYGISQKIMTRKEF